VTFGEYGWSAPYFGGAAVAQNRCLARFGQVSIKIGLVHRKKGTTMLPNVISRGQRRRACHSYLIPTREFHFSTLLQRKTSSTTIMAAISADYDCFWLFKGPPGITLLALESQLTDEHP
jgi:hypothetical protein